MISATITALSRLLFEYHARLPAETISSLLSALSDFLRVQAREIVRSAIGFWKVAVVCLDAPTLDAHLSDLVVGLLTWSGDTKNHFKLKVRHIFERLIRKFGVERLEREVGEDDRKLIANIRKSQLRAKRKKSGAKAEGAAAMGSEDEGEVPKAKAGGQSAFDDALYGSEDEDESEEEAPAAKSKRPTKSLPGSGAKKGKSKAFIEEDGDDEPMDLLNADVRGALPLGLLLSPGYIIDLAQPSIQLRKPVSASLISRLTTFRARWSSTDPRRHRTAPTPLPTPRRPTSKPSKVRTVIREMLEVASASTRSEVEVWKTKSPNDWRSSRSRRGRRRNSAPIQSESAQNSRRRCAFCAAMLRVVSNARSYSALEAT